jgi:hypothetical protein
MYQVPDRVTRREFDRQVAGTDADRERDTDDVPAPDPAEWGDPDETDGR